MPDVPHELPASAGTTNWTAGCALMSLHLLEQEAGFWLEAGSPDHTLHVRLDRLGQVIRQGFDGRRGDPMLPAATVFVPAGIASGWRVAGGFRRLIIRLRPQLLEALWPVAGAAPDTFLESAPAHDPVIDHYAGLVLHEARPGNRVQPEFLDAYARLIGLHVIKRYLSPASPPTAAPRLTASLRERLDQYVRRTLPEPIVIEELAAACGLSHYQLLRLLKRATGETPQQYVLKLRIEMARKMLRESELPLSEIALALGFSSQSHFSNTFKSLTQCTPKAYRERADLI